jgi:excisionase family DNA binding protein
MSAPRGWTRASALSVTEAAQVLTALLKRPVSRSLAYEWAQEGRLPAKRDEQGRYRLAPADLKAFARAERAAEPTGWEQPTLPLRSPRRRRA